MAGVAPNRECFQSRCGGKTGLAARVCGDQPLREAFSARKTGGKETCEGGGAWLWPPAVGQGTPQAKCKRLVRDDGVICVSIGDDEIAHLRLLMDEIFGESNFVAHIV